MSEAKESESFIDKPSIKSDEKQMGNVKSKIKKLITSGKGKKDGEDMEIAGDEHPFVCGVVEGFYGRPWTAEQRKELFRRMEEMGLNTYLYGPKDDYKHRLFWREKYSADEAELLKNLINEAEDHNVLFVYAISPGLDIGFTTEKDITALKEKLLQVKNLGCKAFALLFDDIDPVLCTVDMNKYGSSANAQAAITNLMFNVLDKPRFLFCPTEYCSSMAIPDVHTSQYLKTIGTELDPSISIMWTGSKVISNVIRTDSIKQLNKILKRKVMIWDNIHANDYDPKRVFLGPYKGRSTHLISHVSGVLTNPNCEFESNFVAMHSIATWWKSYKPKTDLSENIKDTEVQEIKEEKRIGSSDPATVNNASTFKQSNSSSFELSNVEVESVGSGRRSSDTDTDTDSDSDYSSHEGDDFFFLTSEMNHGDYDPNEALEKALKDWLPVFSWVKYPSRKVIPRSGTPQLIPPIPNVPLNTRPLLPDITVSAIAADPLFSVGQIGETPEKISKNETVLLQSDRLKDTVIDISSKIDFELDGGDTSLPEQTLIKPSESSDNNPKVTTDVVMQNAKEDQEAKATETQSALISKDSKVECTKIDLDASDPSTKPNDIEMKEDNSGNGNEEKPIEEMQTSPKVTVLGSAVDQMETEDVPEQTTPMITDDVDSDVSMSTAQSGSAVPTDEDMSTPSPANNATTESKKSDVVKLAEEFSKVEQKRDLLGSSTVLNTVTSSKNLISEKYESNPMTVEDLKLLTECFYLPYEHGPVGKTIVQKFKWLREKAHELSRASDKKSEAYIDKALEWSKKALAFEEYCRKLQKSFNKIYTCPNRALVYDLYPYLWDLKGVITMLRSYVQWLGHVEVKPDISKSDADDCSDKTETSKSSYGFLGSDPESWAFRGGLSGDLQRLLPIGSAFDLFCQTLPVEPNVCTVIVRPYVPADEKSVYAVCYDTVNDGMGSSECFADYKDLPADRLVGALLILCPEYCFVAEDDNGVCGYLVAALDAKKFWTKYEIAYLPDLLQKYERPSDTEQGMTEPQKIIEEFYKTKNRFDYGSEELLNLFPSLLTLGLHPRANSNIVKSMLVCLLSALKSHRSCGVHTIIPSDSHYYLDLYSKLGLSTISSTTDETLTDKNIRILGRSF